MSLYKPATSLGFLFSRSFCFFFLLISQHYPVCHHFCPPHSRWWTETLNPNPAGQQWAESHNCLGVAGNAINVHLQVFPYNAWLFSFAQGKHLNDICLRSHLSALVSSCQCNSHIICLDSSCQAQNLVLMQATNSTCPTFSLHFISWLVHLV